MPEMILDSLFLIANAYIDKHGKLPVTICIRRKKASRLYHITKVVEHACKVTGMKPPSTVKKFKHVKGIIHKAVCVMHRTRKGSPYYQLTRNEDAIVDYRGNIVDLRKATCNVSGMGRARLLAVANGTEASTTQQQAEAAIELVRSAEVILVDSEKAALNVQFYLAERALTALVLFGKAADALNMPSTEGQWSKPTVDFQ